MIRQTWDTSVGGNRRYPRRCEAYHPMGEDKQKSYGILEGNKCDTEK